MTEQNQKYYNELIEKGIFKNSQIKQFRLGLEHGLTSDEIDNYAQPKFNNLQMIQIRKGLEKGLNVSIYINQDFNWQQMKQIYLGLKNGLTAEEVSLYAKQEFDDIKMEEIRWNLEDKLIKQNDFDNICENAKNKAKEFNQNQDKKTVNQNQNKEI